jgi:hypothetical protein
VSKRQATAVACQIVGSGGWVLCLLSDFDDGHHAEVFVVEDVAVLARRAKSRCSPPPPFAGALVAIVVLGDPVTAATAVTGALTIAGTVGFLTDHHGHEHIHEPWSMSTATYMTNIIGTTTGPATERRAPLTRTHRVDGQSPARV